MLRGLLGVGRVRHLGVSGILGYAIPFFLSPSPLSSHTISCGVCSQFQQVPRSGFIVFLDASLGNRGGCWGSVGRSLQPFVCRPHGIRGVRTHIFNPDTSMFGEMPGVLFSGQSVPFGPLLWSVNSVSGVSLVLRLCFSEAPDEECPESLLSGRLAVLGLVGPDCVGSSISGFWLRELQLVSKAIGSCSRTLGSS